MTHQSNSFNPAHQSNQFFPCFWIDSNRSHFPPQVIHQQHPTNSQPISNFPSDSSNNPTTTTTSTTSNASGRFHNDDNQQFGPFEYTFTVTSRNGVVWPKSNSFSINRQQFVNLVNSWPCQREPILITTHNVSTDFQLLITSSSIILKQKNIHYRDQFDHHEKHVLVGSILKTRCIAEEDVIDNDSLRHLASPSSSFRCISWFMSSLAYKVWLPHDHYSIIMGYLWSTRIASTNISLKVRWRPLAYHFKPVKLTKAPYQVFCSISHHNNYVCPTCPMHQ
jgi:hypothetical protein